MNYRGYDIRQDYDLNWRAIDFDADYDFAGDPGSYFQCSGMPPHEGKTVEAVKAEIDDYFEDLE